MRVGGYRIQRFDGTSWKKVEFGEAFPEQPEDGAFFQLDDPVPGTTAVDGDSKISPAAR